MREKVKTTPSWLEESPKHKAALANISEHFYTSHQNVIDEFKGKCPEDIKNILKKTAHPFAVCMENWIGDFNFSSLIRNANGFNAKEVYYIGNKKYDKRGSVGSNNYIDVNWIATIDDLKYLQNKYVFVGIDNIPGSISLPKYDWAPNSLMIFGSEGTGLTNTIQKMCKDIVSIPMFGSVRSFNCSSASAVVMYDYITKY